MAKPQFEPWLRSKQPPLVDTPEVFHFCPHCSGPVENLISSVGMDCEGKLLHAFKFLAGTALQESHARIDRRFEEERRQPKIRAA